MRKNDYSFGILLVFVGLLFLLLNIKVLSFEWLLFILSLGLLIGYFIQGHIGYLISGLILLAISLISLLIIYILFKPFRKIVNDIIKNGIDSIKNILKIMVSPSVINATMIYFGL